MDIWYKPFVYTIIDIVGILEAVPNFAGLLGGKVVEVTGPCFLSGRSYSLVFGNSRREKSENCITEDYGNTMMKVRCEIPMLTERGQVPVFMKANDGKMEYNTTITIGTCYVFSVLFSCLKFVLLHALNSLGNQVHLWTLCYQQLCLMCCHQKITYNSLTAVLALDGTKHQLRHYVFSGTLVCCPTIQALKLKSHFEATEKTG